MASPGYLAVCAALVAAWGVRWLLAAPRRALTVAVRQGPALRAANALLWLPCALRDRFGVRVPRVGFMLGRPLSLAALMAAAERRTGLHDWGASASFPALFGLAVDRLNEARPSPVGRLVAFDYLMRRLEVRLRVVAAARSLPRRPEMSRAPVFVVGLPRTGTTLLHRLLALDGRFRYPETHELLDPLPAPGRSRAKRVAYWDAKLSLIRTLARFRRGATAARARSERRLRATTRPPRRPADGDARPPRRCRTSRRSTSSAPRRRRSASSRSPWRCPCCRRRSATSCATASPAPARTSRTCARPTRSTGRSSSSSPRPRTATRTGPGSSSARRTCPSSGTCSRSSRTRASSGRTVCGRAALEASARLRRASVRRRASLRALAAEHSRGASS